MHGIVAYAPNRDVKRYPYTIPTLRSESMTIDEIRECCIVALASDSYLLDQLVLKGGNALALIHKIGNRASVDLDYSIEEDVDDPEVLKARLKAALEAEFSKRKLVVVGVRFQSRPRSGSEHVRFGGYRFEFMLAPKEAFDSTPDDIQALGRAAILTGPNQQRKFRIEISRYEYCGWKQLESVAGKDVYVYSPDMIVAEKLRALCQQMPDYRYRSNKTPRPRDLYDIYACILHAGVNVNTPEFAELLNHVFRAKSVPLQLLDQLENHRDFHFAGWDSVQVAVAEDLDEFDFYFDFVLAEVNKSKPFWEIDSPE